MGMGGLSLRAAPLASRAPSRVRTSNLWGPKIGAHWCGCGRRAMLGRASTSASATPAAATPHRGWRCRGPAGRARHLREPPARLAHVARFRYALHGAAAQHGAERQAVPARWVLRAGPAGGFRCARRRSPPGRHRACARAIFGGAKIGAHWCGGGRRATLGRASTSASTTPAAATPHRGWRCSGPC